MVPVVPEIGHTASDLVDETVRAFLRALPDDLRGVEEAVRDVDDWPTFLEASFRHAVAGVILARLPRGMPGSPNDQLEQARQRQRVEAVRQDIFRGAIHRILGVLARAGIVAVALKGPLLAARLYGSVVRPSTDLDILVEPSSLDATVHALRTLGYVLEDGHVGRFFRDHHHHVHLFHRTLPMLELHIDAYQGFGSSLPSAPLLARSSPCGLPGWTDARVLTPEDEFLYLCVHAASHRFQRLGWLFDLKLLVWHRSALRWEVVAARAATYGLSSPVRLACTLLSEWLGVPEAWGPHVPRLGRAREFAAQQLARPKSTHVAEAAAAFLYSSLLCDDVAHAAAFAARFVRVKALHELPLRARSRFVH